MTTEAGARLKKYLREGMAKGDIETWADLAREAGVGRDTLQVWIRGDRQPTTQAGGKVAAVFGETYADLLRAWQGDETSVDDAAMIAAFEWAIQQVRAGQVPPEVRATIERSRAGSKLPRPTRRA